MNTTDDRMMHETSQQNESVWLKPTHDFRIQKCARCNEEMEISEGSVIFGERWYHGSCWKAINQFS